MDIDDGVVTVESPSPELRNQGWLLSKSAMAERVFAGTGAEELRFVDRFERPAEDIPEEEP